MDIKHYYEEKGQGENLVLLHGNGENSGYFHYQLESYSKHYHVYAPDTRGHGKTPRGTAPFTISQFADDLKAFLDERGIEKTHVLGFSDGANIAMVFALRYPQYVDKLILNGGNLNGAGVKPSVQLPIIFGYHVASLFAKKDEGAKANAEKLHPDPYRGRLGYPPHRGKVPAKTSTDRNGRQRQGQYPQGQHRPSVVQPHRTDPRSGDE